MIRNPGGLPCAGLRDLEGAVFCCVRLSVLVLLSAGFLAGPAWGVHLPGVSVPGLHASGCAVRAGGLGALRSVPGALARTAVAIALEPEGEATGRPAPSFRTDAALVLGLALALAASLGLLLLALGLLLRDRRRARALLEACEARSREFLDRSPVAMCLADASGRMLYVNPRFTAITGYDLERLPPAEQWLWPALPDPAARDRAGEAWVRVLERAKGGDAAAGPEACRITCRDGATRYVEFCAVEAGAGRLLLALTDVTERETATRLLEEMNRKLEGLVAERTRELQGKTRDLELANRELQALDEVKSTLLNTVSHELRTPLTSIYGFVKLIQKEFAQRFAHICASDPELAPHCGRIRDNLEIIEAEGRRLGRMINDFLDLSKIESGRMAWRDAEVMPAAVMGRAARLVLPNFAARPGVDLVVEPPDRTPNMLVDEDRLVQVLVNILDNACKHTESGLVQLSAVEQGGSIRFTVADTGPGIPDQDLERIFDKFYQVPPTGERQAAPRGTGLGLAISRQIVEHYGGRIWAQSGPGRGAQFHVLLPLLPREPEAPEDSPPLS